MLRRMLVCSGSLVVFFVTLLGLVGIFDALAPTGPQQPDPPTSSDATLKDLARSGHSVGRRLCVVVEGQRLRARVELRVNSDERLVSALWRNGSGPSGADLVSAVFGGLLAAQFREWPGGELASEELTFGSPRLVAVGGGTARILIDSDPYVIGARRSRLLIAAPSVGVTGEKRKVTLDVRDGEVDVTTTGARLSEVVTSVRAAKSSETALGCASPLQVGMIRYVYLLDDPSNDSDWPDAWFTLIKDRRVAFWASDIAGDTVPALDPLLWIGLNAFPYGLVAWYLWRRGLRHGEATNVALCLFWLLVVAGALWTARNLDWGPMPRQVTEGFSRWVTGGSGSTRSPLIVVTDSIVPVGALAWTLVCWALDRPAPRPTSGSWRSRTRAAVPYLATAATAAAAAATLMAWSPAPWAQPATIPVAAVLGAILAWCITVLVAAARAPALSGWGVTVLGVAAVGATAISPFAFTILDRGWWFLARSTYLFAVACVTVGGAILLLRGLREWVPQRRRVLGVALGLYLVVVGICVVPRTVALVKLQTVEAGPWNVPPFVDDLSGLLFYVVLIAVIVALRRFGDRRADAGLTWLHRSLGVVFVLLNFYWYTDRWLYLPVPILLGWALAVWWLLPRKQARLVRRTRQTRAASGVSPADEGERLLELSRAERRHRGLLSAGANSDLEQAKEQADRIRQQTANPEIPPLQQRFFGIPDEVSPRTLGVRGAVLGAWLGIPWMAVFLIVLTREGFDYGTVAPDRYPALWMLSYVVGTLTLWPLCGFFLGYFFPYLRGNNAVVKALAVFVTLAVPSLAHALLWWQQDLIQPTLWWALQALVFSVTLGMLMDYRIARSADVDRGAYIEIRGLTTLLGWSGAVVAATVTAAITLLQSTAALYVQKLLDISSGGPTGPGGG